MQELQYHIEQSRHLGQQVPGPKSAALDERRKNALPCLLYTSDAADE